MSDDNTTPAEDEVEGHVRKAAAQPEDDSDVEGHGRAMLQPEDENDVEGHGRSV